MPTSLLTDNPLSNFIRGFLHPFRAAGFLLRAPRLYKYVLLPLLINIVVFILAVFLGMHFFNDIAAQYLPHGQEWYWLLLGYFLKAIAVLLTMVLVFFGFTVVGCLIASPFNDLLSERTEELLSQTTAEEEFSWLLFWTDARRTLFDESRKIFLFVGGMLLLLLLYLVPVFGGLLYPAFSLIWTLFFLIIEYTGYVFSRKRLSFKKQRQYILARKFLMLGFGSGVLCLLALPFLQLLCIPLAVVGATRLCHEIGMPAPEGQIQKGQRQQHIAQ